MKTIIDLEKDNLFDFFISMDLNQQSDFIEKYSKSEEEGVPSGKRGFPTLRKLKN